MPKRVDHELRRREIVESTWRLIARNGFQGTTTRDLAAEMGLAVGAVNHYFPTKEEILLASYKHVFVQTDARYHEQAGDRRGIEALRTLAQAMTPIGDQQQLEARIVLPFWEGAATSERFAAVNEEGMQATLQLIRRLLAEAEEDQEISPNLDHDVFAMQLLALLSGLQPLAVLMPHIYTNDALTAIVDAAFAQLQED